MKGISQDISWISNEVQWTNEWNEWMNEWVNELEYQNPIDYQLWMDDVITKNNSRFEKKILSTYLGIKSLSVDYFWWNDFYSSFQFTYLIFEKNKDIIMFQLS